MGQAKKDLMEQEAKKARKEAYLLNNGYNKCSRCGELFIPEEDEQICPDCWKEVIEKE